jgi:hypothetical protein
MTLLSPIAAESGISQYALKTTSNDAEYEKVRAKQAEKYRRLASKREQTTAAVSADYLN